MSVRLTKLLLEDQHGAKTNSLLPAGANVDARALHQLEKGTGILGVERDIGTLHELAPAFSRQQSSWFRRTLAPFHEGSGCIRDTWSPASPTQRRAQCQLEPI